MNQTKHTPETALAFWKSKPQRFLSDDAFLAYVENNAYATESIEELMENAQDQYAGYHKDFTALAESLIDDGVMGEIPPHLANYIDAEKFGRDLRIGGDYWENNGYFFRNE